MKHILSLFITMFLLGCQTSNVEAQSIKKQKFNLKYEIIRGKKKLLMILNGLTENQKEYN